MLAQLDEPLGRFHEDLDRAGHLLSLIDSFRNFAATEVPEAVLSGATLWPEAEALAGAAPRVRTDLPILAGAILLYVCGRFEYFVRDVVIAIADAMADAVADYSELPSKVRQELMARTLDIAANPGRFSYDQARSEALIVSLAENLRSTPGGRVTVSSSVLAITEANMNSRTLADVLKRIGITELWADLGKQAKLKYQLNISEDRACSTEAQSRLDQIMKDRNSVAHPTGTASFPGPDQVRESLDFLRVLSQVLVDVVLVPR